jgi:hypothetical protein
MDIAMREHGTSDNKVFRSGKIYYTNSISITNFMWTHVPDHQFKNIFLAYFALKLPNKISMSYLRSYQTHVLAPHRSYTLQHPSYSHMGLQIQNNTATVTF